MPHGDKYIGLTNYLKTRHKNGADYFTLSFEEIERACGFKLSHTQRTYFWANDRTQSYALGWMLADFVVVHCDLAAERITFQYDPEKVTALFSGQGRTYRKSESSAVKLKTKTSESSTLPALSVTAENINYVNQLFAEDLSYQTDGAMIKKAFSRFPLNTEREIVAMKVSLIDLTNSTHLGQHREKIYLAEIVDIILNIPEFDRRVSEGDPLLVNELARSNGKINLFSFASKYCLYHNMYVYHRDDYSIYDHIVANSLPQYVSGLTKFRVNQWRTHYDYPSFLSCITSVLEQNQITMSSRRRKFDIFLWYMNRKQDSIDLDGGLTDE